MRIVQVVIAYAQIDVEHASTIVASEGQRSERADHTNGAIIGELIGEEIRRDRGLFQVLERAVQLLESGAFIAGSADFLGGSDERAKKNNNKIQNFFTKTSVLILLRNRGQRFQVFHYRFCIFLVHFVLRHRRTRRQVIVSETGH